MAQTNVAPLHGTSPTGRLTCDVDFERFRRLVQRSMKHVVFEPPVRQSVESRENKRIRAAFAQEKRGIRPAVAIKITTTEERRGLSRTLFGKKGPHRFSSRIRGKHPKMRQLALDVASSIRGAWEGSKR